MTDDPRRRLTSGISRARLVAEARRSVRPLVVFGVGVVLTILAAAYLTTNISSTFGRDTYEVRFAVPEDFGVFPGFDDVRFRGVPVGTIAKVERRGHRLILVAKIRTGEGTVYRDAHAQIRPITPLNDVYLDIVDPGTRAAGRANPSIPLDESQTQTSVTVPDVLNVFDENVQRSTTRLLDQLGNGTADRGLKLRQAFIELGPFLGTAGSLLGQIADNQQVTKRLVHNAAVLTTELGRRETQLRRLVTTGAAAAGTLGTSSGDLDSTLTELGPTFRALRLSLASVRGVVSDVDHGLSALNPVANRLDGGLKSIRTLSSTLRPAVDALRAPVAALTPWTSELDRVTRRLLPIATSLRPQAPTVDRLAQRLVDCERGVVGFFQWNTSLTKFGDANAPIPRGNLAFGVPAAGLPSEPLREAEKACTPGPVVRAVPTEQDAH